MKFQLRGFFLDGCDLGRVWGEKRGRSVGRRARSGALCRSPGARWEPETTILRLLPDYRP